MSEIHSVLLILFGSQFLNVAQCLGRLPNFRVSILAGDDDTEKKSDRFSRHARTFAPLTISKDDRILINFILQHAKKVQASVLLPVDESSTSLLIRNKEQLSGEIALPPLPQVEAMNIVVDKWSMAMHMVEKGIPTPITLLFSPLEKMQKEIGRLTFPVLVKSTVGRGGRGIRYFAENTQLQEFLLSDIAKSENYIIQEFIAGHAVDCSVLCRNGEILAHTIQQPFDDKVGRFSYSRCIEFIEDAKVLQTTADLVSSLKWSGVAHVDMQYDEQNDKLMVIELNPRFWGTLLGSHAVGVNFPLLACLCALDKEFLMPSYNLEKFYDKWEALQYWLRKISFAKSQALPIRSTMWAYILNDPLPFVFSGLINVGHKITNVFSMNRGI